MFFYHPGSASNNSCTNYDKRQPASFFLLNIFLTNFRLDRLSSLNELNLFGFNFDLFLWCLNFNRLSFSFFNVSFLFNNHGCLRFKFALRFMFGLFCSPCLFCSLFCFFLNIFFSSPLHLLLYLDSSEGIESFNMHVSIVVNKFLHVSEENGTTSSSHKRFASSNIPVGQTSSKVGITNIFN